MHPCIHRLHTGFSRLIGPRAAVPVLLLLAASPPGARGQFRETTVNRTVVQHGLKATLLRLVIVDAPGGRSMVMADLRLTDAANRPLTIVRGARLALVEAKAASDPLFGRPAMRDPARLDLQVTGVPQAALRRVRTVTLEVLAASLPPTKVWANVPVQPVRAAPPGLLPFRGGARSATVTAVFSAAGSHPGGRVTPTITAAVTETGPDRPKHPGLVRLDAPGLRQTGDSLDRTGRRAVYETTCEVAGNRMPNRVTLRYYSTAAVTRALRPYRFTFSGVRLP